MHLILLFCWFVFSWAIALIKERFLERESEGLDLFSLNDRIL